MRYLILSDLHANLPALDAVLADANRVGYDAVLVLGDLVGYGADPSEVLARTLALEPVGLIRGNHDKVCAGLEPSSAFNELARISIEWTADTLSPSELQTLAALPQGPQQIPGGVEIAHGAPFDEDFYVFDDQDAGRALAAASARICLVGHTHVPAIFATGDIPPGAVEGNIVHLPATGIVLANVGSVGQPRDGDPRAAYGVLDVATQTLTLHRVPYDIDLAQRRIMVEGLPSWLAVRLGRGE